MNQRGGGAVGYGVAIVSVVLITLLRLMMERINGPMESPFLLFALAVVAAAWVGGFRPGMLATFLSLASIDYLFLSPRYTWLVGDRGQVLSGILFVLEGVLLSALGESNWRSLRRFRLLNRELESRVGIRTEELSESNIRLSEEVKERKSAEQKMLLMMTELRRSNKELQDFASVASHDLQEPLRKIQAFGDRLKTTQGQKLDDQGLDYLDRMQKAAGRMGVLINDLLTYSRVTTRAQAFVEVDLNQIAEEVVSDLEHRLTQTGGRIEIGPLPALQADPLQIRQLFQNLMSNALKFHKPGVPPIVTLTQVPPEPDTPPGWISLRVADNGIGFDEKYLDRIFGIFQRLHGRSDYEGTGVGLAVCRKIAERHGGPITARSAPGAGAAFVVSFPSKQTKDGKSDAND